MSIRDFIIRGEVMKLHCKCGVDYEGHHASKYCPQCKAAGLKVSKKGPDYLPPTESYA